MRALRDITTQALLFNGLFALFLALFHALHPILQVRGPAASYAMGLFYLPHAATTLGAWLFRWRLPLYGLPVVLGWYLPFRSPGAPELILLTFATAVLANEGGRLALRRRTGASAPPASWTYLVGTGALAAGLNLAAAQAVFHFAGPGERLAVAATLVLGQLSGLVGGLLLLMLAFRLFYRLRPPRIEG